MQNETAPQKATVNSTIALRRFHSDRVSRIITGLPPAARSSAKVVANRLHRGKLSVAVSRSRLICRCVSPRPKTARGLSCAVPLGDPPTIAGETCGTAISGPHQRNMRATGEPSCK